MDRLTTQYSMQKRHNSVKTKSWVMILFSAYYLIVLYICTYFHVGILNRFRPSKYLCTKYEKISAEWLPVSTYSLQSSGPYCKIKIINCL